ncbi:short-chain alcohol dehydrogenase-like protein [Clathrospora elynae]|uniref:Short-chain alcohol dehydrogenase-like protein n=1 Tax=Clathrospora elynae TaxID=706981 RepID=A0A6A5SNM4_9PLEO|nr:short-chain alcohol dehydrogenase-like protein [Clathrospora elynae]
MVKTARYSSLQGKVIAISGAASGMGLATAKLLYPMGVKLSLTDNRADALDAALTQIKLTSSSDSPSPASNNDIFTTVTDVRSSSQVDSWIQSTIAEFGVLHSAANFAGIVDKMQPITSMSDEDWRNIQDVNLNGMFYALRAQLRVMGSKGGSIVNAASIAGLRSGFATANYTASKSGIIGLTRVAAREVGSRGIRVNVIAPGLVDTPMSRNFLQNATEEQRVEAERVSKLVMGMTPLQRYGQADDIAKLAAFLLSDESSYITGAVHVVDGGLIA